MRTKMKKMDYIIMIAAFCMLFTANQMSTADEPTSTISPSDDQSALTNDTDENMTLSTSQVPTPDCPDDTAQGSPTFYWDYGTDLDAEDNLDYSTSHPETLTVKTDQEGSYQVTVYCEQSFVSSTSSNTYTEDTLVSTDLN